MSYDESPSAVLGSPALTSRSRTAWPALAPPERAAPDFQQLLGQAAWRRLPARVRRRFAPHASACRTVYRGRMSAVRASRAGRVLAQLCRLLGTPLAPHRGKHVPVSVHVFDLPGARGTVWERRYHFPHRSPVAIRSIKRLDRDGMLLEVLGAGLRMRLRVYEADGELHFLSVRYFVELLGLRVALPAWFPPGTTHVVHRDEGGGLFRFILSIQHPWFGEMFYQEGVFADEGVTP